ncbi:MAG: carbon starvation CstA family protein, partial [Peptostreptococcus anaerobius]
MITFLIGIVILVVGGILYGKYVESVFGPDDRPTPATKINDGVDYVPMKKNKNALIELLNIAGTGPILGPIQGILFGPIAFLLIPIGCVLGGAMHDYFSGMISIRSEGKQMPALISEHLGGKVYKVYNVFVIFLMILVGAVFIYTPGDLIVVNLLKQEALVNNPVVWIVYGCIFVYYLCATLFPIDKIIGKVY